VHADCHLRGEPACLRRHVTENKRTPN
jgi:hypothetical protein